MTITADKRSEETADQRTLRLKAMGSDELLTEFMTVVTHLANLIACSDIRRSWNPDQFKPDIEAKRTLVSALHQEILSRMPAQVFDPEEETVQSIATRLGGSGGGT